MVYTVSGGVARSRMIGHGEDGAAVGFEFAQISDSHIGFNKEANKDVTATLQEAVAKINALPSPPAFMIHTGIFSCRQTR